MVSALPRHQNDTKKVKFAQDIEYCLNLIAHIHPNPDEDVEYDPSLAMVIARTILDLQENVTEKGTSFVEHCLFQEGLLPRQKSLISSTNEIVSHQFVSRN